LASPTKQFFSQLDGKNKGKEMKERKIKEGKKRNSSAT
jgi:hypothetical protein